MVMTSSNCKMINCNITRLDFNDNYQIQLICNFACFGSSPGVAQKLVQSGLTALLASVWRHLPLFYRSPSIFRETRLPSTDDVVFFRGYRVSTDSHCSTNHLTWSVAEFLFACS